MAPGLLHELSEIGRMRQAHRFRFVPQPEELVGGEADLDDNVMGLGHGITYKRSPGHAGPGSRSRLESVRLGVAWADFLPGLPAGGKDWRPSSGLFGFLAAQDCPINVWPKVFTADLTVRNTLNGWAAFSRNTAQPPIHYVLCFYAHQARQFGLASDDLNGFFDAHGHHTKHTV